MHRSQLGAAWRRSRLGSSQCLGGARWVAPFLWAGSTTSPMKSTLLVLLILAAAGCSNPGIVQLSPDTYMLSRASAAGAFVNYPKLKAEVIRQANEFAESKGKVAVEVSSKEHIPTIAGLPSFEYRFRLADKTETK